MLIFGLRVCFRTIGHGVFHCQRCGGDREYRRRVGRRWFHVFFVPVVRLDKVGEHLQCTVCRGRYRTGVLAVPTAAQMEAALPAGTLAAATCMLLAGDPGSGPARRRVVDAVKSAGLADYDESALDEDLVQAAVSGRDIAGPLNTLAAQLAVPAREWFLADVVRIGLADGQLSDDERLAARQVAANLGLTAAHAYGVITMTEEAATAE
jgi:Tellurite resistance protein TerB